MPRSFEVCASQYKEYLDILHEMLNEQHVRDPRRSERYQSALHGAKQTASELNALVGVTSGVALLPQESGHKSSVCIVRGSTGYRNPLTSASSSSAAPAVDAEDEEEEKDEDHFLSGVIVKFPSTTGVWTNCPFEVFFDTREWLPCVILEVRSPSGSGDRDRSSSAAALEYMHGSEGSPLTRPDGEVEEFPFLWRYTVGIIGYNAILENIVALHLRPFDAASHVPIDFQRQSTLENHERSHTALLSSPLSSVSESSSMRAHAVHPLRNRFEPCCVERLTLRQTGFVTFETRKGIEEPHTAPKEGAPTAGEEEEGNGTLIELPISHIHLGRVYPVLRKVRQISAGERRERKVAAVKRKKERAVIDRKTQMTQVMDGAATWKSILHDVAMPTSGVSSGGSRKTSSAGYIKKYR